MLLEETVSTTHAEVSPQVGNCGELRGGDFDRGLIGAAALRTTHASDEVLAVAPVWHNLVVRNEFPDQELKAAKDVEFMEDAYYT